MKLNKKRIAALVGVVAVAAFALVFAVAAPQAVSAHGGPGGFSRGGFDAARMAGPAQDTYLADALGITAEDLQAAQQQAAEAGIDQAVAEGLLTQERADQIKERASRFMGMIGRFDRFGNATIDHEALLADALGISVEELQVAQEKAKDAALAQAIADGKLTQEQVEQMAARRDLMNYFQEQGVPEQMKAVIENVVQSAVDDGIITQEQADELLSHEGFGKGFEPRFPGMSGPDGHDFHGKRGLPGFGGQDSGERGRPSFRGFGGKNFTPPSS